MAVKKRTGKKVSTRVAKKAVASKPKTGKRVAKKVSKKSAKKSVVSVGQVGGRSLPRVKDEYGFVEGSDGSKIAAILIEGGADRNDINAKVKKALKKEETVYGNPYNVSSTVTGVIKRLTDLGFTQDSHWRLAPPTPASKRAATRRKSKQGAGSVAKVAKRKRKA